MASIPEKWGNICVASLTILDLTCAGVSEGFLSRCNAATPATKGAAIDVPSIVAMAVEDVYQGAVIPTPGAYISEHVPQLDQLGKPSDLVEAFTVIADEADAGLNLQLSIPSFPDAATITKPSDAIWFTAVFKEDCPTQFR